MSKRLRKFAEVVSKYCQEGPNKGKPGPCPGEGKSAAKPHRAAPKAQKASGPPPGSMTDQDAYDGVMRHVNMAFKNPLSASPADTERALRAHLEKVPNKQLYQAGEAGGIDTKKMSRQKAIDTILNNVVALHKSKVSQAKALQRPLPKGIQMVR